MFHTCREGEEGELEHWPDAPTTKGDSHRTRPGCAAGGWWYSGIPNTL